MSIPFNLAAYTPPGADYPPYVSVNIIKVTGGHRVEITVRSPKEMGGTTSVISMSLDAYRALATKSVERLDGVEEFWRLTKEPA